MATTINRNLLSICKQTKIKEYALKNASSNKVLIAEISAMFWNSQKNIPLRDAKTFHFSFLSIFPKLGCPCWSAALRLLPAWVLAVQHAHGATTPPPATCWSACGRGAGAASSRKPALVPPARLHRPRLRIPFPQMRRLGSLLPHINQNRPHGPNAYKQRAA